MRRDNYLIYTIRREHTASSCYWIVGIECDIHWPSGAVGVVSCRYHYVLLILECCECTIYVYRIWICIYWHASQMLNISQPMLSEQLNLYNLPWPCADIIRSALIRLTSIDIHNSLQILYLYTHNCTYGSKRQCNFYHSTFCWTWTGYHSCHGQWPSFLINTSTVMSTYPSLHHYVNTSSPLATANTFLKLFLGSYPSTVSSGHIFDKTFPLFLLLLFLLLLFLSLVLFFLLFFALLFSSQIILP